MKKVLICVMSLLSLQSIAGGGGSPECNGSGETKVSWPTIDPIFELCYLPPNRSSASQGSSLEIRDVYLNGYYAIERSHIPMLFAEYDNGIGSNGICYRDWKNANSSFLVPNAVENPTRAAITTCDASVSPTQTVGDCPFNDVSVGGSGNVGSSSDCTDGSDNGVTVEKYDDRMVLTTNHSADWYKYSSRYTFYLDGRIAPRFGYGNSTGVLDDVTHFHHAYWRVNFDIDGAENDQVFIDNTLKTSEFFDMRNEEANTNWTVKDTVTERGYRLEATAEDYLVSGVTTGNGYHPVDVMATQYKVTGNLTEYSDTPGENNLNNCGLAGGNLINGESIDNEDVVLWYRAAVKDIADIGLVCKFAGPVFYPVGDWGLVNPDVIFENNFE